MVAVLAIVALLAVLVWYQSTGVSTRQRWRAGALGQLAPEPPWPAGPTDPDARFEPVPRSRIVIPTVVAAVLAVAGTVSIVLGAEPLGVVLLVIAALEAGAAVTASRHNREAVAFAVERLLQPPPTGAKGPDGPT